VAVGGDGTVHEVVNGMMARKDGKRLPVGVVGNGSGNAIMLMLGIGDVEVALDYIVAGCCIKADIYKVLIDKDEDTGIPVGLEGHQ
jgi:diacylglycerol kinase family enzyme